MKHCIPSFISVVLLILLPFALCANDSSSNSPVNTHSQENINLHFTPDEMVWLEKNQPVEYVYDPDWAPFEWKNDIDNHTGIIADILNLINIKAGTKLIPVHTDTWEESVELVKSGKVGMFSAITQNSSRAQYLDFTTRDIYTYPAVFITKFDDKTVYLNIGKDFENKTIGIVKSSGLGQYIRNKYPDFKYKELSSTQHGFTAMRNNDIDLFAINTVTAKYFIEKKGFSDLKIALKLDYIYHLKIAVRKDMPDEILSILDKTLGSISEQELNDIFNKWTEISTSHQTDWSLLLKISIALFSIIVFLIWSNRRLNIKVKERTKELIRTNSELNNALQQTQLANKAKTLFLANVSHEIRTPMNGVLGMIQTLRNTNLDDEQKLYIETLDSSSNLLLLLIDDLLDLSKIESGKMVLDIEPFDVFNWVADIQDLIEPLFENKETIFTTEVSIHIPEYLEGDSARLLQIAVNLLANAAKWTSHGEVKLVIGGEMLNDKQFKLNLSIKDTGIGIANDKLQYIFEAFHQLETGRTVNDGVGLGLSICKRLADIMNGDLQVSSTLGKGSCFTFTTTLSIPEKTFKPQDSDDKFYIDQKYSILLVDDNRINRFAARRLLEQAGQEVVEAENGKIAIEALSSHSFDVILMDIHMPVMDGVTATREIRAGNEKIKSIPIIGITASVMKNERDRYISAGMNAVVAKPIIINKLMKVINTLI